MILPPNVLVPSSCAAGLIAQLCSRVFRVRLGTMFNHIVSADFSTLQFFAILPIGEIELTEYKLSKCVRLVMRHGQARIYSSILGRDPA